MNVASEQDLELLEEYLDEALSSADASRVQMRLAYEPQLAAMLDELRAQRATRAAMWSSLEPSDANVKQFTAKVKVAARKQDMWYRVGHAARFGSAAAACLLVGVFIGWLGQSRSAPGKMPAYGGTPGPVEVSNELTVSHPTAQGLGVRISQIGLSVPPHRPMPVLLVHEVLPNSPADEAGIRPGDVLLALDGELLRDGNTLDAVTAKHQGQRVVVRVLRDRTLNDVGVQLR